MDKDMREFLLKPIVFKCPKCQKVLNCSLNDVGSQIVCKHCDYVVKIGKEIQLDEDFKEEYPDITNAVIELLNEKS